jgi:excisionase family DNA binding protein
MNDLDDLLSITDAAQKIDVGRNTLLLAAKKGTIKSRRIGRDWFVFASDLDRWKQENYRPDMAYRYPAKKDDDS